MSTFKNTFIDQKKNILIPLLQRDYVQGGRTDIVTPLLNKIRLCLVGNERMSFNYIYGYDDESNPSYYIAIDGQQRLTTLWLIHLYLYSLAGETYPVTLSFQSRYAAHSFCGQLMSQLPVLLKEHRGSIVGAIQDSQWFRTTWNDEPTVNNILKALGIIDKWEVPNTIADIHFENVTFSFLNMKEKGLDDDVYIKMNGRGRPLSYFENIKSWMDEQVGIIWKQEDGQELTPFVTEWKTSMDDKWASLFWNERNKGQEHPEEVDDEQLRFLYSALLLYWVRRKELLTRRLPKDEVLFSSLCDFLDVPETVALENSEALTNGILRTLQKGEEKVIPLFWIETIDLFNKEVFDCIKTWLDKLCALSPVIAKQSVLFPDFKVDDNTSLLYHIAFEEASYGRTLPILYAILKCPFRGEGEMYHWLRVYRNLVFNSTIGLDNLDMVLSHIDSLSETCSTNGFASFFDEISIVEERSGFSKAQAEEESIKARYLKNKILTPAIPNYQSLESLNVEDAILYLENKPQFQGQIRFMFKILGNPQNSTDYSRLFQRVGTVMEQSIVRNDRQEIRTSFRDSLFRRALMTYPPHCFGSEYGSFKWQHIQGNQWKDFISSSQTIQYDGVQTEQTNALKELVLEIIRLLEEKSITTKSIESCLQIIVDRYSDSNHLDCYWKHFVRHPGIWSYMTQKLTNNWENENDIYLIRSANVGPTMELRTLSLYLDICDTGALSLKESYRSWESPRIYEYEGTCFHFDKNLENECRIAIDVYHGRNNEDDYRIRVFLRRKEKEAVQDWRLRELAFFDANPMAGFSFIEKEKDGVLCDARMIIDEPLTRQGCIKMLKTLLERGWES